MIQIALRLFRILIVWYRRSGWKDWLIFVKDLKNLTFCIWSRKIFKSILIFIRMLKLLSIGIGELGIYQWEWESFQILFNLLINKFCCDDCHLCKQSRIPFSDSSIKTYFSFQLLHCGVWGKYHTPTPNGMQYFLTIVDDYTRVTWVFLMKIKTEVVHNVRQFFTGVEKQYNGKVQILRSYNGSKFLSNAFQDKLKSYGIIHQTSCATKWCCEEKT